MKNQWASGVFQKDSPQLTAEANAAALAQTELLEKLLEVSVLDIEEALEEDE